MTAHVVTVLRALIVAALLVACATRTGPSTVSPDASASARVSASPGGVPSTLETKYVSAREAITLFHVRLDQRNFPRLYSLLDPTFKQSVTESSFTGQMSALRDRVGASVAESEIDSDAYEESGDAIVTIIMETTFEKDVLTETFVWRVTSNEMTFLVSYNTR